MKHRFLNLLALTVIGMGGAYLATPSPAFAEATLQATCGPAEGECCTYDGEKCRCGPCEKV